MKFKLRFIFFIASLTILSCKKSGNSASVTAMSQWTFNGTTYKVSNASYEASSNELLANDDPGAVGGGNFIRVFFWSATKPTGNVLLTVVDYGTATPNPANCSIQVGNLYDVSRPAGWLSTGKAGDKVTLTVSSTGKLTVSFSNITVLESGVGGTTKIVSGTVIE